MTLSLERTLGQAACRRRSAGGFTLLEIIITLGVLGLLATLLVVNLGGVTRNERLRAAARKLAGMSDWVRSQAVATRRTCFLDVDFDHNRYRFRMEPPRDAYGRFVDPEDPERRITINELEEWKEAFAWESLPSAVYFRRLWINDHQFYDKDIVEVTYKPNGTLNSYILWVQAVAEADEHEGSWYSVTVNGLSGKSEVLDAPLKFAKAEEGDFRQVMGSDVPGGSGK